MNTVTLSMRLPESDVKRFESLANELGTLRPAFLRQALKRGVDDLMFERACHVYRNGEATLARAAEIAGLSLPEMMAKLRDAGLELNYGVAELQRDLQS
ncbi:MAG: UPF0175 family protein [Lentisphaeria bacterium]